MPVWTGALVTAGDVAFYGTMDRWFKAVDAKDGKPLWKFHMGSGLIGQPVTYQGADGAQYVAIISGVGGWPGVVANAQVDARVRNGALGFVGATQDLPTYTQGGGELVVFAIPKSKATDGARRLDRRRRTRLLLLGIPDSFSYGQSNAVAFSLKANYAQAGAAIALLLRAWRWHSPRSRKRRSRRRCTRRSRICIPARRRLGPTMRTRSPPIRRRRRAACATSSTSTASAVTRRTPAAAWDPR